MIINTFDEGEVVFFVDKNLWERSAVVRKNLKVTQIWIDLTNNKPTVTYELMSEKRNRYVARHENMFKTLAEAVKDKEGFTGYHR